MSLVVSLLVIATGYLYPGFSIKITDITKTIDFNTALMEVMLAFLLFAGAIHIDIKQLKQESTSIITFLHLEL